MGSRLTLCMLITQSALSHICELDGSLGAGIHEPVAALGMKLGGRDNLGKFLHVCRLDIHNVEALVLDVQVPQVYAQIITTDERLSVTVDRNAVDVVGMSIGVRPARHCSNYCVVVREPRQLEIARIAEMLRQGAGRTPATSCIRRC